MCGTPAGRTRIERLRSIRRKMSLETFERTIPIRPGWKREYFDGRAYVRPSWTMVRFDLPLVPRQAGKRVHGLRPLNRGDAPAIETAFIDSFRFAPEYADYTMARFRRRAADYVAGFFGDTRGRPSDSSAVVVRGGRVVAAAMVKVAGSRCPLLDCVFVRPDHFRLGLASTVTTAAVNHLAAEGHRELNSYAMLANEASLAWHAAIGFRERPDLFVAQARCFSASHELKRREKLGVLSEAERARLTALADRWWAELQRIQELPPVERYSRLDD